MKPRRDENDFSQLSQNRTRSSIFKHVNAIWKNVYSIVVARRRVFYTAKTQLRHWLCIAVTRPKR